MALQNFQSNRIRHVYMWHMLIRLAQPLRNHRYLNPQTTLADWTPIGRIPSEIHLPCPSWGLPYRISSIQHVHRVSTLNPSRRPFWRRHLIGRFVFFFSEYRPTSH